VVLTLSQEAAMTPTLVILSAVSLPGAPAPKPPVPYFVTQRGARLVYQAGDAEKVLVVSAVEEKEGTKVVTISQAGPDGKAFVLETVVVSQKGLFHTELFGWPLGEPLCLLKLPYKPGDKWVPHTWQEASSVGEEEVTAGSAKYRAVRVDWVGSGDDGSIHRCSFWYARGVGEIKMVVDGEVKRILKSFTPGRPDPAKP
jgi:hypothetical protein